MTVRSLATGPDGQWAIARDGHQVVLLAGGGAPPVGRIDLDTEDADLALVGPPPVLVVVSRTGVVLHETPSLEAVARLPLGVPARLAAVTGPRLALVADGGKQVTVVRTAARALASQVLEVGGPVELVVGLPRDQLLVGVRGKLEVWDAVSGRPLRKLGLQLPPPPRSVGAAAGHLWATRPGSDEVFVYRLSDGRPFRHYVGAPVDDLICHPASPVIVLVTRRGLVRLNCFAHSLVLVDDAPWTPTTPLALLVAGDDIALLGLADGAAEPWRVGLGGAGGTPPAAAADPEPGLVTAADRLRAMRAEQPEPDRVDRWRPGHVAYAAPSPRPPSVHDWREPLVVLGHELVRNVDTEPPATVAGTELDALARRLGLSPAACRAAGVLYALHLVGHPALSIARLARVLADWTEALGGGELAQLAMVRRDGGKVALRQAVTDMLDGTTPRAIRLVGGEPAPPRAGAFRISRDGRTDAEIETALEAELGRIAVVEGRLPRALLEARLHGATAVAMTAPAERPRPWPRGAGLVLVLYGPPTSWIADLPAL